jgi:hypothetical protein
MIALAGTILFWKEEGGQMLLFTRELWKPSKSFNQVGKDPKIQKKIVPSPRNFQTLVMMNSKDVGVKRLK